MQRFFRRVRANLRAASTLREVATHWQTKYVGLRTQARERASREREERERLKAQSTRRVRRIPSVEALQHMLQIRTPLARARAARLPRRAADAAPPAMDAAAHRTSIDGLTWWVPALPSQSATSVERMLKKQRFPYLAISQTRDVSIGGIMIDVGANVGRMAVPRVILGDSLRAYCAEPDALNYQCLEANVRDNGLEGLVVPDHVAISDHVGWLPLQRGGMSGAHRVVYGDVAPVGAEMVRCTTLDAFVSDHDIDLEEVTFVKVDTQGSEVHVLAGGARVLRAPHVAWQIEVAPAHLRRAGSDPGVLYRLLTEQFSHFWDMNPDADGPRLRSISNLTEALAYLERDADAQTDIVVYRAGTHGVPREA